MDNATNQCSVCQATFATPEELAEHAKTHSGMGQMAPEAPAAPTMGSPMGGSAEPEAPAAPTMGSPMGGSAEPEAPSAPTMGSPMGGSAEPASTGGMASSMPSEENKDSDSQS